MMDDMGLPRHEIKIVPFKDMIPRQNPYYLPHRITRSGGKLGNLISGIIKFNNNPAPG